MRRKAWLTIATRGEDAVSRASKRRPATIGRSIVAKYSGVTQVNVVLDVGAAGLDAVPPSTAGQRDVRRRRGVLDPGQPLDFLKQSAANGLRRGSGTSSASKPAKTMLIPV